MTVRITMSMCPPRFTPTPNTATELLKRLRHLPFLLRNLRAGFQYRCRIAGVDTDATIPPLYPVTVVYRAKSTSGNDQEGRHIYRASMSDWRCPLCDLHGTFKTREVLNKHLSWDHSAVSILWEQDQELTVLTLEIPPVEDVVSQDLIPRLEYKDRFETSSIAAPDFASNAAHALGSDLQAPVPPKSPEKVAMEAVTIPVVDTAEDKKFKIRGHSPSRSTSRTLSGTSHSRSTSATAVSSRTASTTPSFRSTRYPTPPPPSDPLGPSAQYPYLPIPSENDGEALYSCRPGGPRLYDLLNTMSLDEFGVLSWVIIDREEEMFEIDDVRDEDKVMHALWSRWIFLNRNVFIASYPNGMRTFVKQNWRMIHRAAGWAALRNWLLVFVTRNFLSAVDAVQILKSYQELTGMQHWYMDGSRKPADQDDIYSS
ncbi:hypothetical protein BV22DRAFT_786890 [Leucogyrophana mollusca]|uniref:Uncharacterized protein n=1 Tax=Leucogyrophana mollusca TaxID=85980 RepID=A0ACB8B4T5_9AGAM|nr:hypothetical protein BV22DRAFT_786890 [Leucogyrophana mollusca]